MLQCSILRLSGIQVSIFTSQKSFRQSMLKATKLTGMGKLMDATRVIQRTLFGTTPQPTAKPAVGAYWATCLPFRSFWAP